MMTRPKLLLYRGSSTKLHVRLIKTSAVNFPLVLWTLQTSCSSLLLRSLLKCVCKTSPGYSHALSLFTRRIYPQAILYSSIGLHFMPGTGPCIRPPARDLPPSFFRFCLTTDTLGLGCTLLTAGCIWYFHPLEHTITGRTRISGFCHKRSRTRCFKFRGSRFQSHDSACWTSRYHQ